MTLAFEDSGGSGSPLVLIHGWMCDRTYLAPQQEAFSAQHRVVSVDLRGHGESDAPICEYTMELMADDVVWLCGQLGVGKPVLIGHSMGGVVALELLRHHAALPRAIVAIDAPIAMPGPVAHRLQRVAATFDDPDSEDAVRRFVNGLFLPSDDAERRKRITQQMVSGPEHVLVSAAKCMFGAPSASIETIERIDVPLLLVAAAGGQVADIKALRTVCRSLSIGQTVGAGHFNQLEVPDQVNAMIARFMDVLAIS